MIGALLEAAEGLMIARWRLVVAVVVWFWPLAWLATTATGGLADFLWFLAGVSVLPFVKLVRFIDEKYPGWSPLRVDESPNPEIEPYVVHVGTSVPYGDLVIGGQPVYVRLKGRSGLLATGLPGSGKTVFVQHFLASLRVSGAEVTILDMKDGGDFRAFAAAGVPVFSGDLEKAVEVLEDAVAKMQARQQELVSEDLTKPSNYWNLPVAERPPLLVYAIDEVQELLEIDGASKSEKPLMERATAALRRLVKLGRSAGVFIVMATQKSDGKAIPTSFRDQIDIRISGRQRTREASRAALGELRENHPRPDDEEAIPINSPGRLIGDGIAPHPVTFQSFYVDEMQLWGRLKGQV